MDYEVDKKTGDTTFAVAYGKRAAAALPGFIFTLSPLFVEALSVKIFFVLCALLSFFTAIHPSEKLARLFFLLMYPGAALTLAFWLISSMK